MELNITERLQQEALSRVAQGVENAVTGAFQYALPKKVDVPKAEPNEEQKPVEEITPEPDKVVVSKAEIGVKATNSSKVWSEALDLIRVGANLGLIFWDFDKKDKELVKYWEAEIDKAEKEGQNLALPPDYFDAKERIEDFNSELLSIKTDNMPESVEKMLYEAFYSEYEQANKEGKLAKYSKWEAILQGAIIILSDTFKKAVFMAIARAIKRIN